MLSALRYFVKQPTSRLQTLIANDPGVMELREAVNAYDMPSEQKAKVQAAVERVWRQLQLNASQTAAVRMILEHGLTLVQGPPGTVQTTLAVALMLVCRELEFAPCLVACPSNDAADDIV